MTKYESGYCSVKDIANEFRCSTTKVYLLRNEGRIKMHKNIAGVWVATRKEIDRILENEKYEA